MFNKVKKWCEEHQINIEVLEHMNFDNLISIKSFLNKKENKSQIIWDENDNYVLRVSNFWLSNGVVIHQRDVFDYESESDESYIYVLYHGKEGDMENE
jgi:hypothetical protein